MIPDTKRQSLLAALLAMTFVSLLATPHSVAGDKVPLRVGFLVDRGRFDKDFSEKDVTLATKVLFGKVLARSGEFEPTFHAFRKESDYISAIQSGKLDYVEIGPLFWLRLPEELQNRIEPVSVIQMGEKRLESFLLLAAPGETLESLKGKRVRIDSGADRGISPLWLNYELQMAGLSVAEEHFGNVEIFKKAQQVLLPTFFGKADACIVREEDYSVAAELNPQIGKRLVPVKTSPEFPLLMTATAGPRSAEINVSLGGVPESITKQTGAQQAFSLLRIKGIKVFKEGDLDGLRKIVEAVEGKAKAAVTSVQQRPEDEGE